MKKVYGDLIELVTHDKLEYNRENQLVVLHGCNCDTTMGAGFAYQAAKAWPEIVEADKRTIKGHASKLGTWTMAVINRGYVWFRVLNLYTQLRYGKSEEKHFDWTSFELCCRNLKAFYIDKKVTFVFPLIGTGHGGGRWDEIEPVLEKYLGEHELILVVKNGPA